MAHELTQRADGTTEMAYVGEVPWHGLGQKLEPGTTIEGWTKAAGMDFTVRKTKLLYYSDRGQTDLKEYEDRVAIIRSDTGAGLGIVSPAYKIVQPFEVLEFFRDLTADHGFTLETAGTMFGGRRYWALAKMSEVKLAGWDRIGGYLLLTTSADGTFASEARETTVRVVCNNTLSMACAALPGRNYVRLDHRQAFDSKMVKQQLGLAREHFAAFTSVLDSLTKAKVTHAAAEDFLMKLLRPIEVDDAEDAAAEEVADRKPRGFDMIMGLFDGAGLGSTQKGSKGTAWGLVNAVTEYVDHFSTSQTVDHRMAKAWWGIGDKLKTEALNRAVEQLV